MRILSSFCNINEITKALIHGVETRTSSPVRVARDPKTLQAMGLDNLFPAGEGKYPHRILWYIHVMINSISNFMQVLGSQEELFILYLFRYLTNYKVLQQFVVKGNRAVLRTLIRNHIVHQNPRGRTGYYPIPCGRTPLK